MTGALQRCRILTLFVLGESNVGCPLHPNCSDRRIHDRQHQPFLFKLLADDTCRQPKLWAADESDASGGGGGVATPPVVVAPIECSLVPTAYDEIVPFVRRKPITVSSSGSSGGGGGGGGGGGSGGATEASRGVIHRVRFTNWSELLPASDIYRWYARPHTKMAAVAPTAFTPVSPDQVQAQNLITIVGGGQSASEYRMYDRRVVFTKQLRVNPSDHKHELKQLEYELEILKDTDHPNIVKLVAYTQNPLIIALEYAAGGNLGQYMTANPKLGWPQKVLLLYQIANGLFALHLGCRAGATETIVHRGM